MAFGAQQPQLAVAEFSPSAQRDLEAPPTTSGDQGRAGERGSARRSTTTTSAAAAGSTEESATTAAGAATSLVARSRQCFGSPPRQTADPQSPPCAAAIFEGDNGGTTSRGVTSTEIRVAVRMPAGSYRDMVGPMFEYFNRHFELYGRRLVPVFVNEAGNNDPAAVRAAASEVAAQGVFGAVAPYTEWSGGAALAPFYGELARNGIVSVLDGKGRLFSDATLYDAAHPYLWGVYPSAEQLWGNLVDFACTALAGKPAQHAGAADLRTQTRKFGIIATGYYNAPKTSALSAGLGGCTDTDVPVVQWVTPGGTAQAMQDSLTRLRSAGVTTLVCACEDYGMFSVVGSLQKVGFGPELMVTTSSTPSDEVDFYYALKDAPLVGKPFGITERPKQLPWQGQFWFQALQETGQSLVADLSAGGAIWDVFLFTSRLYPQLMVLASGVQAAGPQLTPDTFAQGLMSMQFPNEGAGKAPYWQPSVGFAPGDHTFYDDFAMAWWSDQADALDPFINPKGSWCYLDQGGRARVGSYPDNADARFFDPSERCR